MVIELNRLEAAVYERLRDGHTIPGAFRDLGIRNANLEHRVRKSLVSSGLIKLRGRGKYLFPQKDFTVNHNRSLYEYAARGRKGSKTIDLDELLGTRGPDIKETIILHPPSAYPDDIIEYIKGHAKATKNRTKRKSRRHKPVSIKPDIKRYKVLEQVNRELVARGLPKMSKLQLNYLWGMYK